MLNLSPCPFQAKKFISSAACNSNALLTYATSHMLPVKKISIKADLAFSDTTVRDYRALQGVAGLHHTR